MKFEKGGFALGVVAGLLLGLALALGVALYISKVPVPFINTLIRPNASHKWYNFPHMTRDETMMFKNYDSAALMPANGVGMHSSFHDPHTPAHAPPRESIETRVVCFWHAK